MLRDIMKGKCTEDSKMEKSFHKKIDRLNFSSRGGIPPI